MLGVRTAWDKQEVSEEVIDLMMKGWSIGTRKQYKPCIVRFHAYCGSRGIDPYNAPVHMVAEYLKDLYRNTNMGYSAINTNRSAVSAILPLQNGKPVGEHHIISRVMRGVFKERPALPRYTCTYDVKPVHVYLKSLGEAAELVDNEVGIVALFVEWT